MAGDGFEPVLAWLCEREVTPVQHIFTLCNNLFYAQVNRKTELNITLILCSKQSYLGTYHLKELAIKVSCIDSLFQQSICKIFFTYVLTSPCPCVINYFLFQQCDQIWRNIAHFGKILTVFYNVLWAYLLFGIILILLWTKLLDNILLQ